MANANHTKHALLTSLLALVLCFTMLLGTTYAWFTDSVESGKNKIVAGNLDVELYHQDKGTNNADVKVDGSTTLFDDVTPALWEPGAMAWEKLTVANEGSLALKYQLALNVLNATVVDGVSFTTVLKVAQVAADFTYTRENVEKIPAADWSDLASFTMSGELAAGGKQAYGIVIWWQPSANDNLFNMNNGKTPGSVSVEVGVSLVASQLNAEEDSFGPDYDKEATYPAITSVVTDGTQGETALTAGDVTVTIPANAAAGSYTLEVANKSVKTENGSTTVAYDITMYHNGIKASGDTYTVEIEIGTLLDVTAVTHNGSPITTFAYDELSGLITFKTTSFSPFAITYEQAYEGSDFAVEDGKIVSGNFVGTNPAEIDPSLAEADSAYMAVAYEKNGVDCYVISERATTVVVDESQSGSLYKVFQAAAANGTKTVYILPGTYNEATTITVSSSVEIIGLGDTEDIKIVKIGAHSTTTKKPSNRHLFNCTNSNPETYIEVTIRNLYLNATEKNSYYKPFFGKEVQTFEDNAAVQSIRRSKVKCYDLIIEKDPADSFSKAFYVNSDNKADDGKYYPAYMYAENIVVNSKNAASVVDASGSGKSYFYYSGVYYADGTAEYTNTKSYTKNIVMEEDDWDW